MNRHSHIFYLLVFLYICIFVHIVGLHPLTRFTIDNHCSRECPEAFVPCRFASMGCNVRVKRKALADHESNSSSNHLALMMKEHLALKELVRQLKDENARLRLE